MTRRALVVLQITCAVALLGGNETMSRALWGTKNPLGSHITTESPE
jgi:hypothetical protein